MRFMMPNQRVAVAQEGVVLLTAAEVLNLLSINRTTLTRWLRQGKLRGYRLGRGKRARLRFEPADVRALLLESQKALDERDRRGPGSSPVGE